MRQERSRIFINGLSVRTRPFGLQDGGVGLQFSCSWNSCIWWKRAPLCTAGCNKLVRDVDQSMYLVLRLRARHAWRGECVLIGIVMGFIFRLTRLCIALACRKKDNAHGLDSTDKTIPVAKVCGLDLVLVATRVAD